MLAHALIEPDLRHSLEFLAEVHLGYSPSPAGQSVGGQTELGLGDAQPSAGAEPAVETADIAWQLRAILEPKLKSQERVFYEIESPLLPVLVDMEFEGVRVDARVLAEFAEMLGKEMAGHEQAIYRLAGTEFNLNSPKQLGEILFDRLKIANAPKKTRTGQYATDEQTLIALGSEHELSLIHI